MSKSTKPHAWWEPVWELVVHVLVGSLLFAVIFAPAVGLDLIIHWLKETHAVSDFLLALLTWTKYAVAIVDALLYVVFIVWMGWLFVRNLIRGKSDHDE